MGESGDGDLEGASAVVTGAAQGLGLGIARELAGQGACVVAADLQLEKAETECARLRAEGLDARAAALDVTDSAAVDSFFAKLGRVDILINNAGVGQQLAPISELPDAEWRRVMDATLTGAFYCCRAAPHRSWSGTRRGRSSTSPRSMAKTRPRWLRPTT